MVIKSLFVLIILLAITQISSAETQMVIQKETDITLLNADTAAINTKYLLNAPLSGNFISDSICGEKISNLSIFLNNENIGTPNHIDEYKIYSNYSCYLFQLNLTKENNVLETLDIKFLTKISTKNLEVIQARDILGNVPTGPKNVSMSSIKMNNTTIFYIGIDVSKDKSDICIKDEKGNDLIQRFEITNKKADLEMLYETIENIKSNTPGNSDVVIGMESTGIYSLPLYSD